MIKKIKKFFLLRKSKKLQKKRLQLEVLETLATICIFLDYDGHHSRNPYSEHLRSHHNGIKMHTDILKEECVELLKGKRGLRNERKIG